MTPDNERLFDELYLANYKRLARLAFTILGSWEAAEDAVQRAFEVVCQKEDELAGIKDYRAWLTTILKNVLLVMERSQQTYRYHNKELTEEIENSPNYGINPEYSVEYIRPNSVSKEDFEIFKYVQIYGFSCEEVASMFGISKAACYKRTQRTRGKLKKALYGEK